MRKIGLALCLALAARIAAAAGPDSLTPATFIPHWLPQAQFAGYFVAYERGMYRQRGIDLTILTGGPDRPASEALENGRVDFATLWLSTAIQMRARGVPIVNVAQVVERSALLLVARKTSGINTPADMNGKKVGVWDGDFMLQPQGFFKQYGLDVRIVPLASSVNLFVRGGVDVVVAMWYNEYHTILNTGINADELNTFFFHEHGLNFPEDGIYCREEMLRADPDRCRAFAQASLAGWQYAFAHPDEALDIVMRYMADARVASNRPHQRWMLARMKDIILPADNSVPMGALARADYERVAGALQERGSIPHIPDFDGFYRPPIP
jgi:NitT/TauT family transport system substrate-binding protein